MLPVIVITIQLVFRFGVVVVLFSGCELHFCLGYNVNVFVLVDLRLCLTCF